MSWVLLTGLALTAYTDLRWRWVPNVVVFPGLVFALFMSGFSWDSIGGVIVGGGLLLMLNIYGGDVKLAGMIGAFVGIAGVIEVIFVAALLGFLWGQVFSRSELPFAPFLGVGTLLVSGYLR